jgi:hypothetical protein
MATQTTAAYVPSSSDLQALRWYVTQANHGRGRVRAEIRRLVRGGYLKFQWSSRTDWVITITAKGLRAALSAAPIL